MTNYIPADKLKAEIKGIIAAVQTTNHPDALGTMEQCMAAAEIEALNLILDAIKGLQQEQPEIDEIKREWYNKGYLKGRKESNIPARELGLPKSLNFQKEQSEVDLEKEIDRMWNPRFNLGWDDNSLLSINHKSFEVIARHFFNLGLNARKEGKK